VKEDDDENDQDNWEKRPPRDRARCITEHRHSVLKCAYAADRRKVGRGKSDKHAATCRSLGALADCTRELVSEWLTSARLHVMPRAAASALRGAPVRSLRRSADG
jgi:hypothetical protein